MSDNPASQDDDLISAATVMLLRDREANGADGPSIETLMLRRNSKIAFGGMWVFPGGRVDDEERIEGDPIGSAKDAAVREVHEETGLSISTEDLATWSFWMPPPAATMVPTRGPRRRFSTWFFAALAPAGDVAIDHGEIHDHRWLTVDDAMAQHQAKEIEIVPPTWVTLWQLGQHDTVAAALQWAQNTRPLEFRTRPISKDPFVLAWEGDAAYDGGDINRPGPRRRLTMAAQWQFEPGL